VKRLCLLLLAGLLVASAPAAADDTPTPTTIPAGVTINGVDVGGMTAEVASAAVLEAFQQPLHLQVGSTEVLVTPDVLGATPVVDRAIQRALVAQPNTAVSLGISIVSGTIAATSTAFFQPVLRNACPPGASSTAARCSSGSRCTRQRSRSKRSAA